MGLEINGYLPAGTLISTNLVESARRHLGRGAVVCQKPYLNAYALRSVAVRRGRCSGVGKESEQIAR